MAGGVDGGLVNIVLDPPAAPASTHAGVAYRPDIDGLRAIAVLAVVLYHADIGPFSGGFVGVDIFFVISGYLIMTTLMSDLAAGRFSIAAFYERRIRRIFPALFAMLAVTTAVATLVLPPSDFTTYGQSLVAAAVSLSNFFFDKAAGPAGYFDNQTELRLLLHTWSLSVEEQFYLVLPLTLWLLRGLGRPALIAVLALAAAISLAFCAHVTVTRPSDAFYLVPSRAWELLAGCLLAVARLPAIRHRMLREAVVVTGLALIGFAIFEYTRQTAFPGTAALLPCIGAVLLIYAGAGGGPTLAGRMLSSRPSTYIGRISYSLYLWHWPAILFVAQAEGVRGLTSNELTALQKIAILAISFGAAIVSFHFVEQPFRRKGGGVSTTRTRARILAGGAAAILVATLFGGTIAATAGLPGRFDPATRAVIERNRERVAEEPPAGCFHYQEKPDYRAYETCRFDRPEAHNVLVLGDSHGGTLMPVLKDMKREGRLGGLGVVSAVIAGCPISERLNARQSGSFCTGSTALAYRRAFEPDVDIVIIAFSPWWSVFDTKVCLSENDRCVAPVRGADAERMFLGDLDAKVRALVKAGHKVILQTPIPTYKKSIPLVLLARTLYGRAGAWLAPSNPGWDYGRMAQAVAGIAQRDQATLFDARAALCRDGACVDQENGVSLYTDNSHIAPSLAYRLLAPPLEAALATAKGTMPSTPSQPSAPGVQVR